ncbi:SHOCT domain-containing protein [Castellaniella sp. WN]
MTLDILLRWIAWFLLGSWAFFALRIMLHISEQPAGERAPALRRILLGLITVALGWCFIGIVFLSIGIGSMFPTLTMIGAPLSCPAPGRFDLFSQGYSYKPGQYGVVREYSCLRPDGRKEIVTFLTLLYAGLIYSALLMTVTMWAGRFGLRILVLKPKNLSPKGMPSGAAAAQPSTGTPLSAHAAGTPSRRTDSLESRLQELKRLHESGVIDDSAYQARQMEILKEL